MTERPNTPHEDQVARHVSVLLWLTAVALALRIGYANGFRDGQYAALRAAGEGFKRGMRACTR